MNKVAEFAMQIKREREKQGLTQAQLGEMVGVSSQTISAYEKNALGKGKTPTLDNAILLAERLKISLDSLFGLEPLVSEDKTLADIVGILEMLSDYASCVIYPYRNFDPYDDSNIATQVIINNKALGQFFEKREEVYALYKKGTIPRDFYDSWQLGEISKLDRFPLKSKQKIQREAQEAEKSASELSELDDSGTLPF